ncbi:MAG TPA: prepilin-type N-terminal cleavage/methylation domain-containing protein [Methylomirabilota bacterium]|nr:prepilin-type N-terminal cleavage/methylation domain-containing protein [Methylomirabilota bacterium]
MTNERGFSLAELLVATAVVGLLMLGLFVTLQQGQAAYLFGSARAEVQQNARVALSRIVEELRTASSVTALAATNIALDFVDETGTAVSVQYSLVGTDVSRNQTVPVPAAVQPEILVGGVTSLTFTAFDLNGAATTVPGNAYAVQMRITTRPERPLAGFSPANQQVVFEGRVRLRNK